MATIVLHPQAKALAARDTASITRRRVASRSLRPKSLSAVEETPTLAFGIGDTRALYRALDHGNFETCFLELNGVPTSDVLSCSLRHGTLIDPPKYVALSYCWGSAKEDTSIMLEGTLVKVSFNLKAALLRMRSAGVRLAWCDAISINQLDSFERSNQVSLMGQIYAKAAKVVAWLGPASDDSDIAMTYIQESADKRRFGAYGVGTKDPSTYEELKKTGRRYVQESADKRRSGSYAVSTEDLSTNEELKRTGQFTSPGYFLSVTAKTHQSLENLFARPYWRRMWIVQELAKASTVELWCGDERVTWHDLCQVNFLNWLRGPDKLAFENVKHFRDREQECRIGVARMLLSEALVYSLQASLQATDSRDKIYALLGLTLDGQDIVPTPSYSFDTLEVFRKASHHMIEVEGQTSLMLLAGARQNCLSFPSWLPIWCENERKRLRVAVTTHPSQSTVPEWVAECVRAGRETFNLSTSINNVSLRVRAVLLERLIRCTASDTQPAVRQTRRFWKWPASRSTCAMLELWEFFIRGNTRTTHSQLRRPEDSPLWNPDDATTNIRKGLLLVHIFEANLEGFASSPFAILREWYNTYKDWLLHGTTVANWVSNFKRRAGLLRSARFQRVEPDPMFHISFQPERQGLRKLCPALSDPSMRTVQTDRGALRLAHQDARCEIGGSKMTCDLVYRVENCALPVILRDSRLNADMGGVQFRFVGELFLNIERDFTHWTKSTGWTEQDFHEEAWSMVTIF